jgi:hypothetical protein
LSARFMTNLFLALLGGFLVVMTQVLTASTVAWLAFAIAIAFVVVTIVAQADRARGVDQRLLDALAVLLGADTIVCSLIFGGAAVVWLMFAYALGFVALGVSGLTLHEVETWRAEHHLPALHGLAPIAQHGAPQRAA